jgi:hypothetical protein
LINSATFFEVVIVNMVESLVPSFQSLFVQFDNLLTESAPESRLPIPSDLMSFELVTDIILIVKFMSVLEMRSKLLPAIEDLSALLYPIGAKFMTPPRLYLIVLRIFMPFPVVLTAKGFRTSLEGTAIGARVTFLMLPIIPLAHVPDFRTYLYT